MKNRSFMCLGLLSLSCIQLHAALPKTAMAVERKAYDKGASFVDSNPGSTESDIRTFCGKNYPIYSAKNISDIELRLQTACIVGGTERLRAGNDTNGDDTAIPPKAQHLKGKKSQGQASGKQVSHKTVT